jgi:hypothetical protein
VTQLIVPPRYPVAGICRNPLVGLSSKEMQQVEIDVPFYDLAQKVDAEGGYLMLVVNSQPVSRLTLEQRMHISALEEAGHSKEYVDRVLSEYAVEALNWKQLRTRPNDVIEWLVRHKGREFVRVLLQVAILIASVYTPLNFLVPYLIAANIAYNLLVPPRQPNVNDSDKAQGVFSTALAGNSARLDQPIWRNCGRVKITPPFACQPYIEYVPNLDEADPTVNNDQIYYALFAVGIGNHAVERALIGKTAISHFEDVQVAAYLAPGEQPSVVRANVVTSDEVSDLDLDEGLYVGGYVACRPSDKVASIGIDISANQGLGRVTGGGGSGVTTAQWQVEYREINNFGTPTGEWAILANESRTANTNTPQRWSFKYELAAPIRCEVRVVRTNARDNDTQARDGIQWIGLRAYLERQATLNPDTAHYEVVMRSSKQLSNISQRDFSLILRAYVRQWNPVDGWGGSGGGDEVFTRNAAWWLADLWTNPVWGEGFPDDRVDLQGLYEWSLTLDARQDRFDYTFTTARDSWEAAQLIARSGRARAFRRNGIYTIARDELVDIPVTAFAPRNTQPKSMALHAALPLREQPDGIVGEYLNYITWDQARVEAPCPGFTTTDEDDPRFDPLLPKMSKPLYISLDGITGPIHAEREAMYQAYDMAYRRSTVSAKTEMEAMIVHYLATVRWMPKLTGYGQAGDVAFWDPDTLVMGLTEPPDFSGDQPYLTLIKDDGELTIPVAVLPGPTEYDVVLPDLPDFDLVLDDGRRERPKFLLGPIATGDELVKISSIADGGKTEEGAQLFDIEGVIDDSRVHAADNYLLPGPGDIQDPIDDGSDVEDSGGGTAALVRLSNHGIVGGNVGLPDDTHRGGLAAYTLFADGTSGFAHADDYLDVGSPTTGLYPAEWINTAPVEPAVAALYECYAQDYGAFALYAGAGAVCVGTVNTWLSLDVDRTWSITADDAVADALFDPESITVLLRVQIRRIGSTVVQANKQISLTLVLGSSPP